MMIMHSPHPVTARRPASATGDPPPGLLADRLAAMVAVHQPGWRLPRPSELALRYNVSATAMDAAIAQLARRHLLRQMSDGHVYRASPAEYLTTFEPLPGLGSLIDPMGAAITCTGQRIHQQPVPEDVRRALRLAPGARACSVRRTWAATTALPPSPRPTFPPTRRACSPSLLAPAEDSLPEIGVILNPPPAHAGGGPSARPGAFYLEVQPPPHATHGHCACARANRPSP
jgi:hypothetical protein